MWVTSRTTSSYTVQKRSEGVVVAPVYKKTLFCANEWPSLVKSDPYIRRWLYWSLLQVVGPSEILSPSADLADRAHLSHLSHSPILEMVGDNAAPALLVAPAQW